MVSGALRGVHRAPPNQSASGRTTHLLAFAAGALIKKAPFYSKAVIPGGTYKGNDSDTETVAVSALWVSRSDLPDAESLHYGVVKGLFGNKKAAKLLANGHAKGKSMTLDTAFDGVPIPLCPGAEKFYKEAGVK